jgi:hypothetical protein
LNSPLLVGGISIIITILTVSPFRSSVVQSLISVALTDPNKRARRAKGETRRMLSWSFGFVSHEGTPSYLQPCRRCNQFTERRVNQTGTVVVWDNRVDIQDWTIAQSFAIQSSDDILRSTFSSSTPLGSKGCRATFGQIARHELLLPRMDSSARLIRV